MSVRYDAAARVHARARILARAAEGRREALHRPAPRKLQHGRPGTRLTLIVSQYLPEQRFDTVRRLKFNAKTYA